MSPALMGVQTHKELSMLNPLCAFLLVVGLVVHAGDRAPQRPINLNTATATELMQLPRVGAKTAERIIQLRKQQGGFRRVEEILNVKGIGEKSFAKLKPHLTVGDGNPRKVLGRRLPGAEGSRK